MPIRGRCSNGSSMSRFPDVTLSCSYSLEGGCRAYLLLRRILNTRDDGLLCAGLERVRWIDGLACGRRGKLMMTYEK